MFEARELGGWVDGLGEGEALGHGSAGCTGSLQVGAHTEATLDPERARRGAAQGGAASVCVGRAVGAQGMGGGASVAGLVVVRAGPRIELTAARAGCGRERKLGGWQAEVLGATSSRFVRTLATGSAAVERAATEGLAFERGGAAVAGELAAGDGHANTVRPGCDSEAVGGAPTERRPGTSEVGPVSRDLGRPIGGTTSQPPGRHHLRGRTITLLR